MEARIHAWPALEAALASQIGGGRTGEVVRLLVNAEPNPDPEVVVARARAFVEAASPDMETLIVTVLPPSPKGADMALTDWPARARSASLWEFTRLAALDWAKRGVRVNAIALGGVPADPFAPPAEAERAAFAGCGTPSVAEADIAATILGMARMRSMTGQLLRLEAEMDASRLADAARGLRHVFLRDMVLPARIGVHAFEHAAPQRIRVNIDLAVDDDGAWALSRAAPQRDELSRVVDYEAVAKAVRAIVASGHVNLVETLAERIAESCLVDARIRLARVRVEKLDILPDAASVGVEIERRQPVGGEAKSISSPSGS